MSGGVYLKCDTFTTLVQFVRPGENNANCCPVIHWHAENVTLSFYKAHCSIMSGIGNVIQTNDENKPKTQGFMGTCDSPQLMVGKPDRRKWSESKPQSGLMLIFSFFLRVLSTGMKNKRPKHTTELKLQEVSDLFWLSTSNNISNLAGWQVTKTPAFWQGKFYFVGCDQVWLHSRLMCCLCNPLYITLLRVGF